jgi:hypothetical protein
MNDLHFATLCSHHQWSDSMFSSLFKAAYLTTKAFVAYRLPNPAETRSLVDLSVLSS